MDYADALVKLLEKHNALESYTKHINAYKFKDIKALVNYLEEDSDARYAIGGIMSFDNTPEGREFWSRMDIEWKKICDAKKNI